LSSLNQHRLAFACRNLFRTIALPVSATRAIHVIAADAATGAERMKVFTIENDTNNITLHISAQDAEAVADAERFRNEGQLAKIAADWPMSRLVEIWNGLPGAEPVKKFKDRATAVSRIWKAIQTLGGAEPVTSQPEPETPAAGEFAEAAVDTDVAQTGANVAPAEPGSGEQATPPEPPAPTAPVDIAKCTELLQIAAVAQGSYWDALRNLEEAIDFEIDDPGDLTETTVEQLIANNQATQKRKSASRGPRENSKTMQVIAMLKRPEGTTLEEIMTAMQWQKHTTRAMLSAGGSLIKKHGLNVVSEMAGEQRRYYIR
jgi:hypothetical protein